LRSLRISAASLSRTTMSHSMLTTQDVLEQIFLLLRGDTATLRACALVCSSWTLPSQEQLFHHIELIQRENHHARASKRWRLLRLCLINSPHLRPRIRSLAVQGFMTKEPPTQSKLSRLFPRVSCLELSGVLDLPALEHLELNVTSTVIGDYTVGDQDASFSAKTKNAQGFRSHSRSAARACTLVDRGDWCHSRSRICGSRMSVSRRIFPRAISCGFPS
jgi:hypothetical protein